MHYYQWVGNILSVYLLRTHLYGFKILKQYFNFLFLCKKKKCFQINWNIQNILLFSILVGLCFWSMIQLYNPKYYIPWYKIWLPKFYETKSTVKCLFGSDMIWSKMFMILFFDLKYYKSKSYDSNFVMIQNIMN